MGLKAYLFFSFFAIVCATVAYGFSLNTDERVFCRASNAYAPAPAGLTLIAHAAGGLEAGNYSDSRGAFERSIRNGFKLIEIDFSWTSDGKLVPMHDWGATFRYWHELGPLDSMKSFVSWVPTEKELLAIGMSQGVSRLTLPILLSELKENPQVHIVTDVKRDNIKALALIAKASGPLADQIIPQIYSPEEYGTVRNLGFDKVIFTLYRSNLSPGEIANFATSAKLFAVTMPEQRALGGWAERLGKTGIPIFAHTINQVRQASLLKSKGVTGLYTDCLIPSE